MGSAPLQERFKNFYQRWSRSSVSEGVKVFHYLDNLLVIANSPLTLRAHLAVTLGLLRSFWLVNLEKSSLEYLGFQFDMSVRKLFFLSRGFSRCRQYSRREDELPHTVGQGLQKTPRPDGIHDARGDRGQMKSQTFPYNFLARWNRESCQQIFIPVRVWESLLWWTVPFNLSQGCALEFPQEIAITTDATLLGWGAHCQGLKVQGCWKRQCHLLSNPLVLQAIVLGLKALQQLLQSQRVKVLSDNRTEVAYVTR